MNNSRRSLHAVAPSTAANSMYSPSATYDGSLLITSAATTTLCATLLIPPQCTLLYGADFFLKSQVTSARRDGCLREGIDRTGNAESCEIEGQKEENVHTCVAAHLFLSCRINGLRSARNLHTRRRNEALNRKAQRSHSHIT